MLRVLQKIIKDNARGIVVAAYWPTQPWYPLYTSLLREPPIIVRPSKDLLLSVDRISHHPLCRQLTLVAGIQQALQVGNVPDLPWTYVWLR